MQPSLFYAFVLGGLLWDRCMCYLDDIIVYGDSLSKTLANLEMVFKRVCASGFRHKHSKCVFGFSHQR